MKINHLISTIYHFNSSLESSTNDHCHYCEWVCSCTGYSNCHRSYSSTVSCKKGTLLFPEGYPFFSLRKLYAMQLYIVICFIIMKPAWGQLDIAVTFLIGVCVWVRAFVRLFVHPCVRIGILKVKGQICLK